MKRVLVVGWPWKAPIPPSVTLVSGLSCWFVLFLRVLHSPSHHLIISPNIIIYSEALKVFTLTQRYLAPAQEFFNRKTSSNMHNIYSQHVWACEENCVHIRSTIQQTTNFSSEARAQLNLASSFFMFAIFLYNFLFIFSYFPFSSSFSSSLSKNVHTHLHDWD